MKINKKFKMRNYLKIQRNKVIKKKMKKNKNKIFKFMI